MLRQGPVVTDVLTLPAEEPLHRFEHQPVAGYDYDTCGPATFRRIVLTNGKVGIPGGPQYHLISLAHNGTVTLARMQKLRDLVKAGANLLGEPPVATPGLHEAARADAELRTISNEIWGTENESERPLGSSRVFRGVSAEEALRRLQVTADFTGPKDISWIHRSHAEADVYFIASSTDQARTESYTFRVTGKRAELWNPENGEIQPLSSSPAGPHHTQATLTLSPKGSTFVVFHSGTPVTDSAVARSEESTREIKGPWTVVFPKEGAAARSFRIDPLVSWSAHPDPDVRHFSGTAVYTNQFEISDLRSQMTLDLGKVEIMARVKLNGQDLDILWKPPYQVDISKVAVQRKNQLEISVVNLWVNRLIGDAALPEDSDRDKNGTLVSWPRWVLDGKSSPTGRKSFVTFQLWKKDEPLRNSGLLVPVRLSSTTRQTSRTD